MKKKIKKNVHTVLGTKQREAFGPTFWRKVRICALDS